MDSSAELNCPICDKSFSSKRNLRLHKYRLHSEKVIVELNDEFITVSRNGSGAFACPFCDDAYYQSPDTLKRHMKGNHEEEEEAETDFDDYSAAQDNGLDVSRPTLVSAKPDVPSKEKDVRYDHDTAILSAFDAMGNSEKEQRKKLLVARLGDLVPIAIVDQKGKEYNLLANKNVINSIVKLNQTPLFFSLSKKREFVDEAEES